MLHAPLDGEPPWYTLAGLHEVQDAVDLLIVDGPPAFDPGHGTRREPALPRFDGRLVDGATVILDDMDRPGERQVIASWEGSTDWRFILDERAGIAIGRRRTRTLSLPTKATPSRRDAGHDSLRHDTSAKPMPDTRFAKRRNRSRSCQSDAA